MRGDVVGKLEDLLIKEIDLIGAGALRKLHVIGPLVVVFRFFPFPLEKRLRVFGLNVSKT